MPPVQLPLQIKLNDAATFDNFQPDNNEELLSILNTNVEPFVYWYANSACGKTHLVQALCHTAFQQNKTAIFIPVKELIEYGPDILEGLEQYDMIGIDDIHLVAGKQEWERALFNLYNLVKDSDTRLRITANAAPSALNIQLKDLVSRMQSATVYQLHELDDEQKVALLQRRANKRGFNFPADVARYVVTHLPRDMHSLISLLDHLDDASLQQQRKITIPFVKKILI